MRDSRNTTKEKVAYERRPLDLRPDQWAALEELAVVLDVRSRGGPRFGQHSWRSMIARLADDAPRVIEQIKAEAALKVMQEEIAEEFHEPRHTQVVRGDDLPIVTKAEVG